MLDQQTERAVDLGNAEKAFHKRADAVQYPVQRAGEMVQIVAAA
jgi:hypothetical protein